MPISGPDTIPTGSIVESIFTNIQKYGDDQFLIEERTNQSTTFTDVFKRGCSIAVKLKSLGIGKNSVVAFLIENCYEAVSFQVGTWFAEAISCPVNHFMFKDDVRTMLLISRPVAIFCEKKYLNLVKEATENIGFNFKLILKESGTDLLSYEEFLQEDISNFSIKISDPVTHIFLVLYTSGTTGVPKAVKLRDAGAFHSSMCIEWKNKERVLLTSPMFWISNVMVVAKSLQAGLTMIMPEKTDAESLLKCITRLKPNVWFTGHAVLLDMCEIPNVEKYDTSSLKELSVGGSRMALEQKHMIRTKVFKGKNILASLYGSTEVGLITTRDLSIPVDSPVYDSVGKLAPGVNLKVIDVSTGKEVGANQEGELLIKSKSHMAGYMNKDLQTTDLDEDNWWHMGDIAYYDDNHYIYYVRRLKDILKYRGVQIAPAELEMVLLTHPDVHEACVVGKPHVTDGDWPTAFVIKKHGSNLTVEQLDAFVNDKVPDAKKLRGGIYFVSSLPKSAVGKILKNEVLKMLA